MSTNPQPRLTPRDFAILETLLADHMGEDDLLVAAIRKKLSDARIVFAQDLPKDVVTIGARVTFSVDGGWPQERRLVSLEHYVPGQGHQSVASIRGIALLGQSTGERVEIDTGGRSVTLEIRNVPYQPEAEGKLRKKPNVHLVSTREEMQQSPTRQSGPRPGDDPGPSAA